MKNSKLPLVLCFFVLFGSCVTPSMKGQLLKSYVSVSPIPLAYEYNYITLNEIDHQFYYSDNWMLKYQAIGSWDICNDTLYLHPALMYYYNKAATGDSLVTEYINRDDYDKVFLCPNKFLMHGKNAEILEDISDYSDIINGYNDALPDSIFPRLSLKSVQKNFVLQSDCEKLREKIRHQNKQN